MKNTVKHCKILKQQTHRWPTKPRCGLRQNDWTTIPQCQWQWIENNLPSTVSRCRLETPRGKKEAHCWLAKCWFLAWSGQNISFWLLNFRSRLDPWHVSLSRRGNCRRCRVLGRASRNSRLGCPASGWWCLVGVGIFRNPQCNRYNWGKSVKNLQKSFILRKTEKRTYRLSSHRPVG